VEIAPHPMMLFDFVPNSILSIRVEIVHLAMMLLLYLHYATQVKLIHGGINPGNSVNFYKCSMAS
jgi:hypothetical protein